jgi:hypothetical protein
MPAVGSVPCLPADGQALLTAERQGEGGALPWLLMTYPYGIMPAMLFLFMLQHIIINGCNSLYLCIVDKICSYGNC